MAHLKELEAEIGASEKEIFGTPDEAQPAQAAAAKPAPAEGTPAEPEVTPVAEPVAEPATVVDPQAATPVQEPVAPAPEPDVAKPAQSQPEHQEEDWKKRYIGYKSSADATIHGLRQMDVAHRETIQKKDEIIRELSEKLKKTSVEKDPLADLITPEKEELIGKETVDLIRQANQAATEARVKPLEDQLAQEKKAREESEANRLKQDRQALYQEFLSKLGAQVPNYQEIDRNPKFLEWMKQADPTSGQIRTVLFGNAQAAGDVQRVAEFFLEFEKLNTPQDKLAGKITPSSAPAASAQAPQAEAPTQITPQFINQFYDDVVRGRYRGRQKKQQEIEEMIDEHMRTLARNSA